MLSGVVLCARWPKALLQVRLTSWRLTASSYSHLSDKNACPRCIRHFLMQSTNIIPTNMRLVVLQVDIFCVISILLWKEGRMSSHRFRWPWLSLLVVLLIPQIVSQSIGVVAVIDGFRMCAALKRRLSAFHEATSLIRAHVHIMAIWRTTAYSFCSLSRYTRIQIFADGQVRIRPNDWFE